MRRLPLKASAILSLLTAVAGLSAKQNGQPPPPPPRRSISTSRPSSSSWSPSSNIALQSSSQRSEFRQQRRPPLVDSDLLRFLSNKQQQNVSSGSKQFVRQRQRRVDKNNTVATKVEDDEVFTYSTDGETRMQQQYYDDDDAWLRQYEQNAVASLLQHQEQGADSDDCCSSTTQIIVAAGKKVEAMAIARSARRRVRSFLKQRQQVWTTSTSNNNDVNTISSRSLATGSNSNDSTTNNNNNNMQQVVQLLFEYGLSVKDIAEILIHTPSIAFMRPKPANATQKGETLQETLDRVFVGLLMGRTEPHHLRLRKYDARKILRNTPGLLTSRGSKAATETVILLTRLGVSSNSLSRDKNALPTLLSRKPEAVFRLVAFLASDAVRMPTDSIGPLLRRRECQDLLNAVAIPETVLRQNNGDDSSNDSVVAAQVRREVVNDTYRRMSLTAWTLRHEIGTKDLGKVVAAYPSVLLLNARKQILPTAQYLMEDLGIWQDDLPRVLQLYPTLLQRDLEQMKLVVSYLESLDVASDSLGVIIRSFPSLLTLDIEHDMAPVVDFLRRRVGIANVGRFITRIPPVLGYSVEKEIQPKWEFLRTSGKTDPRFEVSKFPAYFSYPLERVIKTRFEYLTNVKRIPIALVSLDQIICYGDRDFAVTVAGDASASRFAAFVQARGGGGNNKPQKRPKDKRQRASPAPTGAVTG